MDRAKQLGYIFCWAVLGPLVVVICTIFCPFVLTLGCFYAAKEGWKKLFTPKFDNYGLTPPPKEIIVLN